MCLREALRDQLARWGDIYRNGLAANRTALNTFIEYNLEQGPRGQRAPAGPGLRR